MSLDPTPETYVICPHTVLNCTLYRYLACPLPSFLHKETIGKTALAFQGILRFNCGYRSLAVEEGVGLIGVECQSGKSNL